MGFCGTGLVTTEDNSTAKIILNTTAYAECSAIYHASTVAKVEFHACVGTVPQAAIDNPGPLIAQAVELAKEHGWAGYNIDDESHTAPRATIKSLEAWVGFINAFADGLHAHGLKLTADIQSITLPFNYQPSPILSKLLSSSSIDRWINMDTYYFSTGRFLDALDFYTTVTPAHMAGIGMMNRVDLTYDGLQARFHAIRSSHAGELDMFIMPINDSFLPYLWKWKTGCGGCPNDGVLSCWSNMTCY